MVDVDQLAKAIAGRIAAEPAADLPELTDEQVEQAARVFGPGFLKPSRGTAARTAAAVG